MRVTLHGDDDTQLCDSSMFVHLPSGELPGNESFHYQALSEGTHPVDVVTGETHVVLPLTIVSTADTLVAVDPPTSIDSNGEYVCFAATNQERFVAGLLWSHLVDGAAATETHNCVYVRPSSDLPPLGTIDITATGGGATTTLTLPLWTP